MLTTHPIRSTAAITLALAGICAPTASAVLIPGDPHPLAHAQRAITNAPIRTPASSALCGDVCSGHGYGSVGLTTTVVRPGAANQGFDWADAAIGAAAAIGLILGATGAALLLARRRTESHAPTDVPTAS